MSWSHPHCSHSPPCADRSDMEDRHGLPAAYREAALRSTLDTLGSAADLSAARAVADAYTRDYAAAPLRVSEVERAAALAAAVVAAGHRRAHEQLDRQAEGLLANYAHWRDRIRRAPAPVPGPAAGSLPNDQYVEEDHDRVCAELGARRFRLVRDVDVSGISGTGVVAVGVVFAGTAAGRVAVHWLTTPRSTGLFGSTEDAARVHGHGGSTRVVFEDEPVPEPAPEPPAQVGATVTPLRLAPSSGAVELLELLIEDARRGHVRSVAFATVSTERCIGTGYHLEARAGLEPHALVGALERLQLRILTRDGEDVGG